MRRIDGKKNPIAQPCAQRGQPGCNHDCYHAYAHEVDGNACWRKCPLVEWAMCGGVVKNK